MLTTLDAAAVIDHKARYRYILWYLELDFSFPSTFVPGSEKSIERTFVPDIRAVKHSLVGTFALRSSGANFHSMKLSCGTVAPRDRLFIQRTFAPNVNNGLKL